MKQNSRHLAVIYNDFYGGKNRSNAEKTNYNSLFGRALLLREWNRLRAAIRYIDTVADIISAQSENTEFKSIILLNWNMK